ncbi:protein NO VEIN domain-containing protein [Phascolarctobacterium faecium]|jgi:hypothetical protein|uniref:protein NO VEIN domain-containing protein n=1 Tax=Phascolarctobacterium faecium TaxID=33025 RepID=UPI0016ACEE01|nr:DUF3883 domain-containing protein [Phascolarctobacterium faecium]NLH02150.1 DUF3883 domain-containing protein [Clostridiales bacterium]DAL51604.1 MAG TPA_asm: protein of unknown function (DUF3883) [Caudoviricetes sp.]
MLTELKRCNSIGNIDGILFLISILAGKDKISRDEIRNRCALENNIIVNCPGAVAFFEYLRLVDTTTDTVIPLPALNVLSEQQSDAKINQLVALSISRLVEDGIFDKDATGFDAEKGHLTIKRSAFPLAYAAIRNFLIMAGALNKEENGEIGVTGDYESNWTEQLHNRRKKFTLEQLLKQQEDQSKRGLEAEEFVLELEKKRLPKMAQKIKRISDFDVAAGYDIVSYESYETEHYDRFIEVKCYIGFPHFFWSENESDVARIKADKYLLCLVDYARIGEPGYQPEFIRNPYETIFNGEEWLVNAASYRIQKI